MRIGLVLAAHGEPSGARLAEGHALFGVLAGDDDPVTGINAAVYAGLATSAVTVAVRVALGLEHPVTLAEEIAVLDNIIGGRTVAIADTGDLSAEDALEEVEIIRAALSSRPFRLAGGRFPMDSGNSEQMIAVTPEPAQIEVPIWLVGRVAPAIRETLGLPCLATDQGRMSPGPLLQPALAEGTGDAERDRDLAVSWERWGASHLFLRLPAGNDVAAAVLGISRIVAPEVGMPDFPRVMTYARPPLPWPHEKEE